jgi:superfamily II DNA or RNA helicase
VRKRNYLPFEEARKIVCGLGLRRKGEWPAWSKTERPTNIPSAPAKTYAESGWVSWGDWLGTNSLSPKQTNKQMLPFEEARKIVCGLGLRGKGEWEAWSKTERPTNIPSAPAIVYKDSGWVSWGGWLGYAPKRWNVWALQQIVTDCLPHFQDMSSAELMVVLNNMQPSPLSVLRRVFGNVSLAETIKALRNLPEEEIKQKLEAYGDQDVDEDEDQEDSTSYEREFKALIAEESEEAVEITTADLHTVDSLEKTDYVSQETIEYLVSNRVQQLWCHAATHGRAEARKLFKGEKGKRFLEIKRRFTDELKQVDDLPLPAGYNSYTPNLMQKRMAWQVKTVGRCGNWSGVGAGKTLSAILSSRVVDAKLTLVLTNTATLEGWDTTIRDAFPGEQVAVNRLPKKGERYAVYNYEKFQIAGNDELVTSLLKVKPDFVVLDEIQLVKERENVDTSKRRVAIETLMTELSKKNKSLRVLGMSATPVINDLYEGKKLLDLVLGKDSGLPVENKVQNAISLHKALWNHGFRYRPQYDRDIEPKYVTTEGDEFLLKTFRETGRILDIEADLMCTKMESVLEHVKKGTIIYTEYIGAGIKEEIERAVTSKGLTCGFYTGKDKSGLGPFLSKKVDVLIGTRAMTAGMDGLQKRSNRMIIASMPWTGAAFEQVVGRIRRQGTAFRSVEIIVPEIVFTINGQEYSWDKQRMAKVRSKSTMARFVLDAERVPEVFGLSETMFKKLSLQSLENLLVTDKDYEKAA